jgi:hypothetical protein
MSEPTCKDRIGEHYKGRISDIRTLWELDKKGEDNWNEADKEVVYNQGTFNEYGLCFDYVAPNTFNDQRRGYFRWQLSTGGPGDEFRFYATEGFRLDYVVYVFLDWFDWAVKKVRAKKDLELLTEIWNFFKDIGSVQVEYEKSMAEEQDESR